MAKKQREVFDPETSFFRPATDKDQISYEMPAGATFGLKTPRESIYGSRKPEINDPGLKGTVILFRDSVKEVKRGKGFLGLGQEIRQIEEFPPGVGGLVYEDRTVPPNLANIVKATMDTRGYSITPHLKGFLFKG